MRTQSVLGSVLVIAIVIVTFAPQGLLAQDVGSWCPDGQKAFKSGKYEDANLALSSCLYSPPEDPKLAAAGHVMRGETYIERLDYVAALSDFDQAIELDPDNALAWREKAWAHYKQNDLHPAITSIDQSLKADPHNTESQHINAQILTALGRTGKAMDAYDLAYAFESKERVRKLQQALVAQGYEVGTLDGVYGAQTREALKACIASQCNLLWAD
ncbi:MAG: tetratricopeptide repeat protein [Xanthomonadales bacterium]|nr:tetratricopeptide repeat protein [Xanthomonadales bacterium]